MDSSTHLTSSHSHRGRWLALIAALAMLALGVHGPITQWASYHQFADARPWGLLPHAANVLSNLPFAVIGVWALWRLSGQAGMWAWRLFATAVTLTAIGSSVYHWQPNNAGLVIDRLPIAWACATLLCAFLAERVDARWADAKALALALAISSLAVVWWAVGEAQGLGDLRPYVFVQFLPMLLIPAALLLNMQPVSARALPASAWWTALALYGLAKALEAADHQVLETLSVVSGHSLKHLLAAGTAGWLLRAAWLSCGNRR
ncbi:MAG: alkaline phytoceramidase [Rhizobacter sp.]|nr:alkaline phytoceramidase [Rhizobacter sp.]